ncbi:MAG TPA: hypothetical protein VGF95_14480 [Solirubrobacteraceae bacterium]
MAFPEYGVEPPTLEPYQWQFQGYTFGPGCALEVKKIEGIDLPTIRSGDSGRPRDHGLFTGLDVMGGREITITGDLQLDFEAEAGSKLAGATLPSGMEELPLYMGLPGYGTLATLARVRKRQMPVDITYALGGLAEVTLLFAAADPRWYGPTEAASTSTTGESSGFSFPFGFDLGFGGGSEVGALQVVNAGTIETRPILVIEGPSLNPSVTNATAPGAPALTFNIALNAGDRLVVDTDMHTVTYYTAGTTVGSDRLDALAIGSQWWVLEPGTTSLQFTSTSGEGELTVQWASARIL